MSRDYTLYSAVQKFVLRTGDLIIGKNSDIDAHIVIYIGKEGTNDGNYNHVVLNSTSVHSTISLIMALDIMLIFQAWKQIYKVTTFRGYMRKVQKGLSGKPG